MAVTPIFNRQAECSFIYSLSSLDQAGLADYWAGYVAGPSSSLEQSASTEAVWKDTGGGFYLFLSNALPLIEDPTRWADFYGALEKLRPNLAPPAMLRSLWISNPCDPSSAWQINSLQARSDGAGVDITWTMPRSTAFRLGEYSLSIAGKADITYVPDESGGGFEFLGGSVFSGPLNLYPLSNQGLRIPFSGSSLGAFTGSFVAPRPATKDDVDVWNGIGIRIEYATGPADKAVKNSAIKINVLKAATRTISMPVFDRQADDVALALTFDPLNTLNVDRTVLHMDTQTAGHAPLRSYLRTTRGHLVLLQPRAASGAWKAAGFVIGRVPVRAKVPEDGYRYHLSPAGSFDVTIDTGEWSSPKDSTTTAPVPELLLGLSGVEYVGLSGSKSDVAYFEGGQPGYAPPADPLRSDHAEASEALTDRSTTSHMALVDITKGSLTYYAQPKEAPLFAGHNRLSTDILDFNEMPAASLTGSIDTVPDVYPVGIYAGLDPKSATLASEVEASSIAPFRHWRISQSYGHRRDLDTQGNDGTQNEAATAPDSPESASEKHLAVTPQGIIAELTSDYEHYQGLIIGNMPDTSYPCVEFSKVTGDFRQALQSNQLFFVAANENVLMQSTSVKYELTEADKSYLNSAGVSNCVITAVYDDVQGKQPFDTESDFVDTIRGSAGTHLDAFCRAGGVLKVDMDGWTFQLSPRSWRNWTDHSESPTVMIAKFCRRSLLEMAGDTSSWGWPAVAVPDGKVLTDVQGLILDMFNAAGSTDASEAEKIFFKNVVNDPAWNGFLFLNAPIDAGELPNDLKFLTAGVDLGNFYAHHVGLSQTAISVDSGALSLARTSAFGLINYVDPVDLSSETTVPFDFKTLQLRARFANASLADFSARAELLVNRLFSDTVTKYQTDHGNNLVLDGSYQKVGETPAYSFVLEDQNTYQSQASILSEITVSNVQLHTRTALNESGVIVADFVLSGLLRFGAPDKFDLYSFGTANDDTSSGTNGLRFGGLIVCMCIDSANDFAKTFTIDENRLSFDLARSAPRKQSLVNHFPLTLTGLTVGTSRKLDNGHEQEGATPEDLGFVSVSAPIEQTPLITPWYGLTYTLDLGTLGALMGSAGLSIELIAAWMPAENPDDRPPQYVGLKLPDAKSIGPSWALQGVMGIGFRSFHFNSYTDEQRDQVYLLKLHRLALSILGISFPPGNSDVILFGDPRSGAGKKLGWYGAYSADENQQKSIGARQGSKRLAGSRAELANQPLRLNGLGSAASVRAKRASLSGRRALPTNAVEDNGD